MKRKKNYTLIVLAFAFIVTGCGNSDSTFTISCTSEKDNSAGFETQNVVTYQFNKEQYVIGYSVETTQNFDNKETYKEYKKAQEESIKENSSDNVSYDLKSNDKKMELIYTMKIKNIDVNKAETKEEKNALKAKSVLKSNEDMKATCKIKGIKKSKLN